MRRQLAHLVDPGWSPQQVRDRAEEITAVARATHRLLHQADPRTAVCQAGRDLSGADVAALYEPDREGKGLWRSTSMGPELAPEHIPYTKHDSGAITAFGSSEPVITADMAVIRDETGDDAFPAEAVLWLCQPVLRDAVPAAVLTLGWRSAILRQAERIFARLELLAAEAAAAIEHADLRARLERIARTDELTGLLNRRAVEEALPRELARASRHGQPLCLAMLDVDRFKALNDQRGHPAGDALLRKVASVARKSLRTTDVIARYGGDEFAVILPDCKLEDAVSLIDRIRDGMPEGQTCSAGVAAWDGLEPLEELVSRADRALYEAKKAGRDQVVAL